LPFSSHIDLENPLNDLLGETILELMKKYGKPQPEKT